MAINSSDKSPFEICDSTGKEFREIYDNKGRLLFKNWNEIQGSLPLNFTSRGGHLLDYRIYGNTVQDGTPTPENPVEVQGCGEYYAELNGYKIPVTGSSITTPVYLGSEPLHKIRDYADYKRGVVVRKIKKWVLTVKELYKRDESYQRFIMIISGAKIEGLRLTRVYCTHFLSVYDGRPISEVPNNSIYSSDVATGKFFIKSTDYTTEADFKSYLAAQYAAGTPVTVWYVLAEPEEEPLENLLPIQTIKGTNILTADTTVQPSEMYIKYRR